MTGLLYSFSVSLDGFIEDDKGDFGWSVPTEELHSFINDRLREAGTHLYGRRLYETMAPWETDPSLAGHSPAMRDFAAIWADADKVVYSTTLAEPVTTRTRIARSFDVDEIKAITSSTGALVGGADLGGQALRAGLVDEIHLYVVPVVLGGGKPALPRDVRLDLELLDERRFDNGTMYLRYRIA